MAYSPSAGGMYSAVFSQMASFNFEKFSRIKGVQVMWLSSLLTTHLPLDPSLPATCEYLPCKLSMRGAARAAYFLMYIEYQLHTPRNPFICFGVEIIALLHSLMAATLDGAGFRMPPSKMCPQYLTLPINTWHFSGLTCKWHSAKANKSALT